MQSDQHKRVAPVGAILNGSGPRDMQHLSGMKFKLPRPQLNLSAAVGGGKIKIALAPVRTGDLTLGKRIKIRQRNAWRHPQRIEFAHAAVLRDSSNNTKP